MILITPKGKEQNCDDRKLVFLAGPIKGAENWQDEVIKDLADMDIYVACPRYDFLPDFNLEEQVDWETKFLKRADVIMFWIPLEGEKVEGRSYAQTTRFELGEWCGRTDFNKLFDKVVLGIADGFPGKGYIERRFYGSHTKVLGTYQETLAKVRELLISKSRIFFTSDTHFDSERAMQLSKRPFASVAEMNQAIVDNWNKVVGAHDTVYHLGDFGALEYAGKLNGNIHFITGNYEEDAIKADSGYLDGLKKIFKSVKKEDVVVLSDGSKLHIAHRPSSADRSMFNAFGHIHGRQMCKRFGLDVGVDAHHYYPISEADILFYKDAIVDSKYYDDEVFLV